MKFIRARGLLKGFFFASRLHTVTYPVSGLLQLVSGMARLSRWISRHRDVPYSDFYTPKFDYAKRFDLYRHVIETEQLDGPIDYLEVGVAKGVSFKWWVEANSHPGSRFYGFDTFTGLPEDWGPFKKGDMSAGNQPPDVADPRASFIQGLFQQTLHPFLERKPLQNRMIIHMDADLYSSTLFVLTSLAPHLKPDDVLIFDEFNVPLHEFKAFSEFVEAYYLDYVVLGAVNNYHQVAIKLA